MTSLEQWNNVIGSTAIDADGSKVGKVGQIYVNDGTGEPEWATVSTGLFGTRESFAPLYNAQPSDGELQLAVTKQLIKDAPNVDTDGHLDGSDIDTLYQHYAGYIDRTSTQTGTGDSTYATGTTQAGGTEGHDTSGPTTDDAMTRSEERLHVGKESVAAGRARLRKYVVTENVTRTVPVSHEEVRVEREPVSDASRDAALDGPAISEEEHEVTLNAERPVVDKEAVPVERVRLGTETVTEQAQVSEDIRKEQIEEPDVDASLRRDR
ncbi:MAG TPA: PRC and DUF2382 domain-containing protein [Streptosporangiaceae bacterium]|nr:PRC and DUF2382 domain-containing protein [Streptosporangiaceae bacterium]